MPAKGQFLGGFYPCKACGKSVYRKRNEIDRNKHFYCSVACAATRPQPDFTRSITAMLKARKTRREKNPELDRQISIANLPKDCRGPKNGNWKGGVARVRQEWRRKNNWKVAAFRKEILKRDNATCRNCGSTVRPEIHHIVALAEFPEVFFCPMNAVTLCRECHKKTDSYCSRGVKLKKVNWNGNRFYLIRTIPPHWHEYPTTGNWAWCGDKILLVFVSELNHPNSELAIAVHEIIEAVSCKDMNVPYEQVSEFDKMFEREREQGKHSHDEEPGDDPRCPYREPHQRATHVERAVCHALDLSWNEHQSDVTKFVL